MVKRKEGRRHINGKEYWLRHKTDTRDAAKKRAKQFEDAKVIQLHKNPFKNRRYGIYVNWDAQHVANRRRKR